MATIHGTSGHDRKDLGGNDLVGTDQADYIYGYGGDDYISGRGGNDNLIGGAGVNTIYAGPGDDQVASDGAIGWYDGGQGVDTLALNFGGSGAFDLEAGAGRYGGGSSVSGAGAFAMKNFEKFYAGAGHDYVWGTAGANLLSGGGGDDFLFGRGGNDTLYGDSGNNYLDGGAGNDFLLGGAQSDTLYGGADADTLMGGAGDDQLLGGAGNDLLYGDAGNDILDGLDGFDTATFQNLGAGIILDVDTGSVRSPRAGGVDVDQIWRVEKVIGTGYADNMAAGRTTALDGGNGNDTVTSGAGANDLSGGNGTDTISYKPSTAAVNVDLNSGAASGGWAAGDTLWSFENAIGSAHGDTLRAKATGSTLDGFAGHDRLFGGAGADRLVGGTGNDVMTGGGGADRFVFNAVSDSPWTSAGDTITDFQKGLDKIDLSGIDANVHAAGNQAFAKVITSAQPYADANFTAGTIAVHKAVAVNQTWVFLNVDNTDTGTGSNSYDAIEASFVLTGLHTLAASDFIL